jgi:hypothetical protein
MRSKIEGNRFLAEGPVQSLQSKFRTFPASYSIGNEGLFVRGEF